MYPNEIKALEEAFIDLSQITSTPPRRPSTPLTSALVDDIISILDRWPSSQRFPGTFAYCSPISFANSKQ